MTRALPTAPRPARAGAFPATLLAAALAAGCSAAPPKTPPSPSKTSPPACETGTLGLEAGTLSRQARERRGLPPETRGAVVTEVLPGGAAERAGLLRGDVLLAVGGKELANDCDLVLSAWGLPCRPVGVVLLRAGARREVELVPGDEGELLGRLCEEGNATACFRRAWLAAGRAADAGERDRALADLEAACRIGSAEACSYAGHILLSSRERSAEAIPTLTRSCDLGSGAGCAHLAYLHATGTLVPRDDARATRLYDRSCDLGDAKGCYNVGLMAEKGRGTRLDLARAAAAYEQACEGGSASGCTNLGFLVERGQGAAKDPARAADLYRLGCEGSACQGTNLVGCVNFGRALRDGNGVAKDPSRAASVFRAACEAEPGADDVDGAAQERWRACSLLGALHLSGTGVPKDEAAGRELSERGCEGGDAFGCFNAAVVWANGAGGPCTAGDGEGCHEAGRAYEKGSGVPKDGKRAAELFRKACAAGFEKSCGKKPRR
ncbi:PDZ domain-containing protein [Acidobacteria bacterium ACD]|nr:PDZ domain-containing protein [Acidobacteria bacterium ACD]